jgi:hypothetical protein
VQSSERSVKRLLRPAAHAAWLASTTQAQKDQPTNPIKPMETGLIVVILSIG